MLDSKRMATAALLTVPAGLMAYFAFNAGGFYPAPVAYGAVLVCLVLAARALFGGVLEGLGWPSAIACGLMGCYCLLTLVSQSWSHAPGLAIVAFTRALLFALVLLLFSTLGRSGLRLAWLLRLIFAAICTIVICGLVTRLLPHVWPTTSQLADNRLSFPVTYWNVLGLLAGLGLVLALHFSADRNEPVAHRILAAAAGPPLAVALYFTFSRGAIAVTLLAVVLYALWGRPRLLLSAALAIGPAAAVAVRIAYGAGRLSSDHPTSAAAVIQGHHVAAVLAACIAGAALIRGALAFTLDRALDRVRVAADVRRRIAWTGWTALAVAFVVAVVASNGTWRHEYHRFVNPSTPGNASDFRTRLTDPGNNGRIPMWRVAWHRFEAAPALGQGAGTFADSWAQYRGRSGGSVVNAHSLYLETLDELGIVGLALLASVIALIVGVAAYRARGPDRPLHAAALAVLVGWALHAGVDWDWQMPVVTVAFFAIGGLTLARPVGRGNARVAGRDPAPFVRAMVAAGCLLLAVAPVYVWLSQRDLNRATAAYDAGNCHAATRSALSSISVLGSRAEPYQVLAYCDVDAGEPRLAMTMMSKAISLDPHDWDYRYGLAIMRAATGLDPRAAARRALTLDPRDPLVQAEYRTLTRAKPSQWPVKGLALARSVTSL
jgi:hypothetical protein